MALPRTASPAGSATSGAACAWSNGPIVKPASRTIARARTVLIPLPPFCVRILTPKGCEGAKVRRCEGAKVRRCEGATVRGCDGARVRRCEGARVRGCEGARVRRCEGARVRCGARVRRCEGATVRGCDGARCESLPRRSREAAEAGAAWLSSAPSPGRWSLLPSSRGPLRPPLTGHSVCRLCAAPVCQELRDERVFVARFDRQWGQCQRHRQRGVVAERSRCHRTLYAGWASLIQMVLSTNRPSS